jgi:integrase
LGAIRLWADASTVPDSARRKDLVRDKTKVVASFFAFANKHPAEVFPGDVRAWQGDLEEKGLRKNAVFQTESVKALSDEELGRLLAVVSRKASDGDLVGKRDYAILLLLLATGMRRAELISLRGSEVKPEPTLVLTNRVKGRHYIAREVTDPRVKDALLDYLAAAGRLHALKTDAPIWTRHDRAGAPGEPLTSRCYAVNMKRYAREAGIEGFHLHQTRHTFARIVSELTGSITDTQNAFDHKNPSTTRAYVQRIAVKRDLYSSDILRRLSDETTDSE